MLFSSVFILVLALLIGFKFANASDFGCNGVGLYSTTTGQLCSTTTLQIGSRGVAVQAFQQTLKDAGFLSGKVDGIYGKMTSAAATQYYKIHAPIQTPVNPIPPTYTPPVSTCSTAGFDSRNGFRCGCSGVSGFSSTTGEPCGNATNFPPGCSSTIGYSTTTGLACDGSTPIISYPSGCTSTYGYSSTTGTACDGSGKVKSTVVGCSITSGYSTTSGLACDGSGTYNPNFPGCTPTSIFNSTTGEYCSGKAPTPIPPIPVCSAGGFDPLNGFRCGCTSISGFSSKDGSSCAVN